MSKSQFTYLVEFERDDYHHRKLTTRLTFDLALSFALHYDYWMIARVRKVGDIYYLVKIVARSCACRECCPNLCLDNIGTTYDDIGITYAELA